MNDEDEKVAYTAKELIRMRVAVGGSRKTKDMSIFLWERASKIFLDFIRKLEHRNEILNLENKLLKRYIEKLEKLND